MIIIDVQADKSVETSALFDSSEISVRPGTDELWAEFDKRVVWHAMNSAVVSGADLRQFEANLLSDALRSTVPVDNIEAIEIYAAFSDPTESLRKSWPRGVPCGEADGLRSSGRAAPATAIYAVIWMKH